MNVLCDGADIGCTGVTSRPIVQQIAWVSLDDLGRPPPGKYLSQLEFTGPVGHDMPTEGIHDFTIVSPAGRQLFRAEAEHHPAHKEWTYRVIEPCPQCGNEDCCSAVREDYEIEIPAKTYWNVINAKAER